MKKQEKMFYIAYGKDGKNYLINQAEFQKLVHGKERFVFICEQRVWLTKDSVIKIEYYD